MLLEFGTPGILSEAAIGLLWNPLCDIVEAGDVDLVSLLIGEASKDSLSDHQVKELTYGLLFLASRDRMPWVERLYNEVVSQHGSLFWSSKRALQLIYLSYLYDCTVFAQSLMRDMLCTVCTHFLFQNPFGASKYKQAIKTFFGVACGLVSKPFGSNTAAEDVAIPRRIFHTIQLHRPFCFFHHLCIKGDVDSVKLVLDVLSEEVRSSFFNKMDKTGYRPLLFAIANGHVDVVKLLLDNYCPLIPPGDGLAELTAAILHIKLTKKHKWRWNSYLPKYLRYLWPWYSSYVSDNLGGCTLECSTYCHALVEYLISVSDFRRIVSSPNFNVLIHEIASLSSLEYAEPILSEIGVHLEQMKDAADSYGGDSAFNHNSPDPGLFELGIKVEIQEIEGREAEEKVEEEIEDDTGSQSNLMKTIKPHKLLCIACKIPPFNQTSQELFWVMDAALFSLASSDDTDGSVVIMASEKGLWLLVKKLLPSVMLLDDVILSVLRYSLSQGQFDLFDSLCSELENSHRTFDAGLNSVICTAINERRVEAVETLLGIVGDINMLLYPLCLAVSRHLHQVAFHILTKMMNAGPLQYEQIYKILEVSARNNNRHMVEHILSHNCYLSDTTKTIEEKEEEESLLLLTTVAEAASHGHQDLALILANSPAVRRFNPDNADDKLRMEYTRALCWCSYWRLTSVLNCLPYASHITLMMPSPISEEEEGRLEVLMPLSYAEARGSIGKLADIDSLAVPIIDWETVDRKSGIFLLLGTYPTFLNMNEENLINTTYEYDYSYFRDIFMRNICYGGEKYIHAFFKDHLGFDNAAYFQFVCQKYDCEPIFACLVQVSCVSVQGTSTLETLLGYIARSGVDFINHSLLHINFIRCVRRGKVDMVKVFVRHLPELLNKFTKPNLLNTAVVSNNPEMVDFILSTLGDLGPDCCFQRDELNLPYVYTPFPYPLHLAFAWGCCRVICDSSLLSAASQVANFEFSKWDKASCCQGWFRYMMEQNAKLVSQTGHLNAQSSETYDLLPAKCFSISGIPRCSLKISLLRSSTQWGVDSVTRAILQSCGGVLVQLNQLSEKEMDRLAHVLMDTTVFNFLRAQPYCEEILQKFVERAKDFDLVKVALYELAKWQGSKKELLELLALFQSLSSDSELNEKIFLSSCELGLSKVAIPLINSDIFRVKTHAILEKALNEALVHRRYDIVAEILAKLNISEVDVEKVGGNELFQVIFSKADYYSILIKFFGSLTKGGSGKMPLSAMWLTHSWSKREAELVVNRLGNMYAPPNPWILPRGERSDLSITIDWNSFSESLLASPLATEQSGSYLHFVPIVIEATVFSPAVLGQIIPSFCNSGRAFEDPNDVALLSEVLSFSSIIVSCSTMDRPSLTSLGGDQGLLTIVYEPSTKRFTFPELGKVAPETPAEKLPPIMCSEDVRSLVIHYRRKARGKLGFKMSIDFGETLAGKLKSLPRYCSRGLIYYDLMAVVLKDVFDALELVLVPKMSCPLLSLKKKVVFGINLHLDCKSIEDEELTYTIKVVKSSLSIMMYLPLAEDFSVDSSDLCTRSFYNKLIEDIRLALLAEHVRLLEKEASDKGILMAKVLSSSLNSCFSTTVITDEVKVFSSQSETAADKHELVLLTVVYIKQLIRLNKFLQIFCKMLNGCKNDILGSCTFCSGEILLDVVCQRNSGLAFFEKSHENLRMVVPVATLLVKNKFYDSLVHTWQSFISVTDQAESSSLNLEGMVRPSVAPIACYIDHYKSSGLFFPIVNNKKVITIQLVDHHGCNLQCLPTTDISLSVHIYHCESKFTEKYSHLISSSNKVPGLMSIEDNKDGTIGVSWEPSKPGLHIVRIFINQIPIRGSPHRCVSMVQKGQHSRTVFVAEHVGDCLSPAPVKLHNKKSIRQDHPRRPLTPEEFKRSLEELPTHLLSLYFAHRSIKWYLCRDDAVSVHIGKMGRRRSRPSVRVHSLGGGLHHVEVGVSQSCSIFVSCPICMGVLKMHLSDGSTSACPVDFS